MAIQYDALKRQFRFKQKDNSEVKFSDYDIKLATNEAIRYLSNALSNQNADFMEKKVSYNQETLTPNLKTEGVDLPADFHSLISVNNARDNLILQVCLIGQEPKENQFKVSGNKLYSGCGDINLFYKRTLPEISGTNTTIDVPNIYLDALVDIVSMIITGSDIEALQGKINSLVDRIVPRRKYRGAKIAMPWKI